jgi:O-acetyl-ADP-ribose deacetylase (regulator of RNase III)
MQRIRGDLLELGASGHFDVIIHGCNCMNTMGKGIALSVRQRFPDAYAVDQATEPGAREKLGTYTCAKVNCKNNNDYHVLTIVNAYTQYHYNPKFALNGVNVDYQALRDAFRRIKQDFAGQRIGYGLIGAGLAGGDWTIISEIIDEELVGEDHTLVEYVPPQPSTSGTTRKRRNK